MPTNNANGILENLSWDMCTAKWNMSVPCFKTLRRLWLYSCSQSVSLASFHTVQSVYFCIVCDRLGFMVEQWTRLLASLLTYTNHLKDIDIRKGVRTREAEEQKRRETEWTYKDFKWEILIESGKIKKLRVKELDFYLKVHGLTTIGRKLDKVKATVRCH